MEQAQETTECVKCGIEIFKQDHLKTIDGYTREECMKLKEE